MARVKTSKAKLWKAIRDKCTDCCGGSYKERQLCTVTDCSLWPYRNGAVSDCEQTGNTTNLE
jgi:hypothetical protein